MKNSFEWIDKNYTGSLIIQAVMKKLKESSILSKLIDPYNSRFFVLDLKDYVFYYKEFADSKTVMKIYSLNEMQYSNCFFCQAEPHPKDCPYCIILKFSRRQYTLFTDNNSTYQSFYNALSALILVKERPKCVNGIVVRLAVTSKISNSSHYKDNKIDEIKINIDQPEKSKENTFIRKRINSIDDLSKYRVNYNKDFFKDRIFSQAKINCKETNEKYSTSRTKLDSKDNAPINNNQRYLNFLSSQNEANLQDKIDNSKVSEKVQKRTKNKSLSYLERIPSKKFIFETKNQNFIENVSLDNKNDINLQNLSNFKDDQNEERPTSPSIANPLKINNYQEGNIEPNNLNCRKEGNNTKNIEEVIDLDNFEEQVSFQDKICSNPSLNQNNQNIRASNFHQSFKTQIRRKVKQIQDYNKLSKNKYSHGTIDDFKNKFNIIQNEENPSCSINSNHNKKILRIQNKNIKIVTPDSIIESKNVNILERLNELDNNDSKSKNNRSLNNDFYQRKNQKAKKSSNELVKELLNDLKGNFTKGEKLKLKNVSINIFNNFNLSKMKSEEAAQINSNEIVPKIIGVNSYKIEGNQKLALRNDEKMKNFNNKEILEIAKMSDYPQLSQSFYNSNTDNIKHKGKHNHYNCNNDISQNIIMIKEEQFVDGQKNQNESVIRINKEGKILNEDSNFNSRTNNDSKQNPWRIDDIDELKDINNKRGNLSINAKNGIASIVNGNSNNNSEKLNNIKGLFNTISVLKKAKVNQSFDQPSKEIIDEWD